MAMEVEDQEPSCSLLVLSRFLFTCGHVALHELMHLDVAVFGELKRRRAVCEANKQSKTGTGKAAKSGRVSNVSVAASATKTNKVCNACINLAIYVHCIQVNITVSTSVQLSYSARPVLNGSDEIHKFVIDSTVKMCS